MKFYLVETALTHIYGWDRDPTAGCDLASLYLRIQSARMFSESDDGTFRIGHIFCGAKISSWRARGNAGSGRSVPKSLFGARSSSRVDARRADLRCGPRCFLGDTRRHYAERLKLTQREARRRHRQLSSVGTVSQFCCLNLVGSASAPVSLGSTRKALKRQEG